MAYYVRNIKQIIEKSRRFGELCPVYRIVDKGSFNCIEGVIERRKGIKGGKRNGNDGRRNWINKRVGIRKIKIKRDGEGEGGK